MPRFRGPEPGTHPQTYTHDANARLVIAELPGSTLTYRFDAFGNMSSRTGEALGRLRHVGGGANSILGRYGYGWHFTLRGGGAQSQAEYVWS